MEMVICLSGVPVSLEASQPRILSGLNSSMEQRCWLMLSQPLLDEAVDGHRTPG